jgi:hypothetical protein
MLSVKIRVRVPRNGSAARSRAKRMQPPYITQERLKSIRKRFSKEGGGRPGTGALFYGDSLIASVGHTSAQVPHPVQVPLSMLYFASPSRIACTGHSSAQVPQDTQSSVII